MRTMTLNPEFVSEIPKKLDEGKIYISPQYGAIVHLCPCGCGSEISTPLNREYGWVMSYDGELLSLSPSVGNYSYPCQSHYFIKDNKVIWIPAHKESEPKKKQKKSNSLVHWIKSLVSIHE